MGIASTTKESRSRIKAVASRKVKETASIKSHTAPDITEKSAKNLPSLKNLADEQAEVQPIVHTPLGPVPDYLDFLEMSFWEVFRREMPWLTAADSCFVEMACKLRAQVMLGTLPVEKWSALRSTLTQMRGQAVTVDKMHRARDDTAKVEAKPVVDDLEQDLFT